MARLCLCISLLCLTFGCAQINVQTIDGKVTTTTHLGVMKVSLAPNSHPQAIDVRTVGLSELFNSIHIGYSATTGVVFPTGCRIIIWIKEGDSGQKWPELIGNGSEVCRLE